MSGTGFACRAGTLPPTAQRTGSAPVKGALDWAFFYEAETGRFLRSLPVLAPAWRTHMLRFQPRQKKL
jgi:hypothetical protein